MKYVLESTGEEVEVPDDPQEQALARAAGLVPAAVVEAGKGTTVQAGSEAFQRGIGGIAEGIQGLTGLGTAPGLDQDEQGHKLRGGGLTSLQEAYSPEARLREQAHPLAAGIGTSLAAAPLAGVAAASGGTLLPAEVPMIGGAIGAIAGESAVQAVAQEYDDAWLEQRPMQTANVAAYTLMFAGGDLLFRGAVKGGKRLLFGPESSATSLGGRNLVSEAQGAARELSPELAPAGGGGSVGAARAEDLVEPFDNAIRGMSDKDAMVLARDSVDHLHLAAQNSSEAFTRINQGLTESLGSQLKYEDFAIHAQKWDTPLLERQAKWLDSITTEGDELARSLGAFAEGDKAAPDLGNLGKKAVSLIDSFNRRIAQETDPARRNWLVDAYKKQFDSLTMGIDASFGVDNVTRTDLKAALAPLREGLRQGLQNPRYWGENAEIQRSLNGPWHEFLKDWPAVQKQVLEATGHTQFDQMGAGRISKESTIDRMLALLDKDPRSNQEFSKHLSGAFDGLQGLIEARQAHGITGTEGLEAMAGDVRNLMEDWNLAQTVGVAKNRVAIMQRDPRKWAKLALDFAERAPVIGKPLQAGRHLVGALTNDLHLEKDTPLGAVWERAYQRYAKNPAMQDPSIARNYADWVLEALGQRGGSVPPPGAVGAPAAPMANDVMTGAPGFRQAAQPGAEGSLFGAPSATAAPSPGAKRIRETIQRRRSQSGAIHIELPKDAPELMLEPLFDGPDGTGVSLVGAAKIVKGVMAERGLKPWESQRTAEQLFGRDAGEIVEKAIVAVDSHGLDLSAADASARLRQGMDDSFGRKLWASPLKRHAASRSAEPMASKATRAPVEIRGEFDDIAAGMQQPPDMQEGLAAMRETLSRDSKARLKQYQSGVGFRMNADLRSGSDSRYAEWAQDVSGALEEAIQNGATAPGLVMRGLKLPAEEIERLRSAKVLTAKAFVSTSPSDKIAKKFASASAEAEANSGRRVAGDLPVLFEVEQATGVALSAGEVTLRPGTQFKMLSQSERNIGTKANPQMVPVFRVREIGYNPRAQSDGIIAGGIIGLGGAGAAAAYARPAQAAEAPPPPAQPPEHAYRDAMREIDRAGDAHIAALASSALRKRPPGGKGKGPLELFAGRRGLQDAVEASRERLAEVAGDPAALVQVLGGSVGELGKTHPGVYSALVQKSAQLAAYLQQHVPPPTAPTLLDPRGGPLSFDRAWDYAARYIGAAQPKVAMREVMRGTAPPEMIEAIQANWGPELWEPFKAHMLGQVQRMAAAGRHIPSEKLRRWDSMLGMDGQLDPSASLAVASHFLAAQSADEQKRQQAGQSKGGGAASSAAAAGMQTRLGAINAERQLQ